MRCPPGGQSAPLFPPPRAKEAGWNGAGEGSAEKKMARLGRGPGEGSESRCKAGARHPEEDSYRETLTLWPIWQQGLPFLNMGTHGSS